MKRLATKQRALGLGVMGALALLLLSMGLALAAGESISLGLVGSGGGEVSAEGLSLRSAIGQPAVGAVGEDLSLCSGQFCGPDAPPAAGGGDAHAVFLPFVGRGP